tara:strand:- start:1284 stop:1520 length:237 start_codon:yes stop_codon:yes gene_type:complete
MIQEIVCEVCKVEHNGATMNIPTFAKVIGISNASAYNAINNGDLPVNPIHVGRRVVVSVQAVHNLLEGATRRKETIND